MPEDGTRPSQGEAETPSLSSVLKHPLQALRDAQKQAEWVSWVNGEYTKCRNARSPYEKQWYINIAFYKGKHYIAPVTVPGAGFRLVSPKAPPWRVRLVVNKIRVAVRTECSKLTSQKPIPVVIPATSEDEDQAAARIAEQILKAEFNTSDFDKSVRDWVWWGVVTGNSFLKSYWDPNKIDEMAQESPQPHPMYPQMMIKPPPVKGKVCVEAINPFHIYVPDLLAESLELQPYIIHVTTKSPLFIRAAFGINAEPDARASESLSEAAFFNGATNQHLDAVLVKEIWIKPNVHPDFPEGGMITVINDKIAQVQMKWPWPFQEFPFYKYEGMPTGEFYTESVVTDLVPLQKEYNKKKSQIIEIMNLMGKPKFLYPAGSINMRQVSSEPGQGIPYKPGFGDRPTVLPAAEVPVSMLQELDRLTSDFDDISGQHEITRGNTPSQVTSGTAISFLQEQDDSKLAYQVAGIENAIQKLGRHFLKYVANYWTEKRLVRVVGRDNEFEAKHWAGSDLRGNTDVRVQSGSALPYSKAARQALVLEMVQMGLFQGPQALEVLDLQGMDKAMEDYLIDKRQAQRENLRMAEADPKEIEQLLAPPVGPDGQPVMTEDAQGNEIPIDPMTGEPWQPQPPLPPNSYDNHEAHIHFHNQFRKTQQFDLLEEPIKQLFEMHVQAHQMALMMPQQGFAGIINQPPQDPQGAAGEPAPEGTTAGGSEPPQPPQ